MHENSCKRQMSDMHKTFQVQSQMAQQTNGLKRSIIQIKILSF